MTPMQWFWIGLLVVLLGAFFIGTAYAVRRRDVTAPGPINPHKDLSADKGQVERPEPGYHAGESDMETTAEGWDTEARIQRDG